MGLKLKFYLFAILTVICFGDRANSGPSLTSQRAAAFTDGNNTFLSLQEDFRSLDVSVPFPALPYLPQISLRGHAHEKLGIGRRDWYEASSRTVRAELPFGLTLEAGRRFDSLNPNGDSFVGLTFRYSSLRKHNKLLAAYKGSPHQGKIPNKDKNSEQTSRESKLGSSVWRVGGALALLAIISGGSGSGVETYTVSLPDQDTPSPEAVDIENPYFVNGSSGNWHMVWNDEFEGPDLDTAKWNTTDSYGRDQCFGGGNNEQQCYTGESQNVEISDGNLILTARSASGLSQGRTYTSGRVQSRGKGDFTYGKFEARIKLPGGQGSWPAFWMLPTPSDGSSGGDYGTWAASGEIDIMEAVNLGATAPGCGAPCQDIHGTLHFGGQWPNNAQTPSGSSSLTDIDAFHTYAIEWYPDEMRWFLDGQQYHSRNQNEWYSQGAPNDPNAPFDRDFHLILNLAIGGNWPGATDGLNFPRQMEIEYVRVYQCGGDDPSACKN